MNKYVVMSAFCLLLIVIVMAAFILVFNTVDNPLHNNTVPISKALPPTITSTIDISTPESIENIPIYPNAQNVSTDTTMLPQTREIHFDTTISYRNVITYYQKVLLQQNWILFKNYGSAIEFHWSDSSESIPWRLHLFISFLVSNNGTTGVTLQITRWPNPNKLPIYPGTQDVTVNDVTGTDGYKDRLTSYVVNATSTEITEYYRRTMAEQGWYPQKAPIGKDALFSYGHAGPEDAMGGVAVLITKAESNGSTRVELRVRGTELATPVH